MCLRYLGFVLLVGFPGALHAQSAAKACSAPTLKSGYFTPKREMYAHDTSITYACDLGYKPSVEGWWTSSTCQNGTWILKPQCIDEKACIPPEIPNAEYTRNSNGWYESGQKVRIRCDEGYEHKDQDATAICINGTWASMPFCEKSIYACGEPPKRPHAVIIHKIYQEVFAEDSKVYYQCEDGYTVQGAHNISIFCIAGNWTDAQACSKVTEHGGSTGGEKSTVGATDGRHTTGTRPRGGGSFPSSAGSNERERTPQFVTINHCGSYPLVPNGVVVQQTEMFLKYQCMSYYKLVTSAVVKCQSDGNWSQQPNCKAAFCELNAGDLHQNNVKPTDIRYIEEGMYIQLPCVWDRDPHTIFVGCKNGIITFSRCCRSYDRYQGYCA